MKVTIDREECIDCGVCYTNCPAKGRASLNLRSRT